jgi:CRISP-associated protein Cas1
MIKRTLYIGNPGKLYLKDDQVCIVSEDGKSGSIPAEDIGLVVLDHAQVSFTQPLMAKLLEHNAALMICNAKHMPQGMIINMEAHTLQSARFRAQVAASLPLQKNLWQQTVKAKIRNQAAVLSFYHQDYARMLELADKVRSGDPDNCEAQAAQYYFRRAFSDDRSFRRHPEGDFPNNMLNYGYAILRALIARAIAGTGLHPTLGISHRNQYNAFCLADDIMEPYRPFVDLAVLRYLETREEETGEILKADKVELLKIPVMDVHISGKTSPLMHGTQRTAASLVACFQQQERKLLYPEL